MFTVWVIAIGLAAMLAGLCWSSLSIEFPENRSAIYPGPPKASPETLPTHHLQTIRN